MNESQNPFASPLTSPIDDTRQIIQHGLSADGKFLLATHRAAFPDRCVKCNRPAEGYRLKRQLSWHSRWLYLLLLLNILIYAIVAMINRKQAKYEIGLCDLHRARRRQLQWVWFGVSGMGALAAIGAIVIENPWPAIVGVPVGLLSLMIGLVSTQVISAKRITDSHAEIKGCGQEFLLSLT